MHNKPLIISRDDCQQEKDLEFFKKNAEEDYKQVPISVLRYITELENYIENIKKII
jgi:hypothetical protein